MPDLDNRRILVTGAAGGLGLPLSETLLNSGAQVIGLVKDDGAARAMTDAFPGRPVTPLVIDLNDAAAVAQVVRDEITRSGPVHGLVNNAAIYPKARVVDLDADEFAAVLQVNAIAAGVLIRTCAPGMRDAGGGRIISVTSNTFDTGMEELGAYVASKGALTGMTRVWARELGPWGITVNAVAPGAFQTDAEKIHPDPEAYSQFVIDQQAIKRRGEPREFADLVTYLLSDQAGFITGQTIRIDGGWVTQ